MSTAWPLTGRREELQFVDTTLRRKGVPRGVVLAGAAGVGKTRVAQEALSRASRRGATVRWIPATASARVLPLGAFAGVVSVSGHDPALLVQRAATALTAGPGSVVIAIDDAHLLDDLSALLVHHLVVGRVAAVLITVRSDEPAPDAVTALWKDGYLERIEVQPLPRAASDQLVDSVLGGPLELFDKQRMWQLTRGNALYLRHVVDHGLAEQRLQQRPSGGNWFWSGDIAVSSKLSELIGLRIDAVHGAVADVLDLLSVGEPLDLTMLVRMTDQAAVEEAETRDLIETDSDGLTRVVVRLAHPMYGQARRDRAGSIRLRRLRGRLAQAMAGDGDDHDILRLATLWLESDLDSDPALFAAAAREALRLSDPDLAERLTRDSVQNGDVASQLVRAQAFSALGDGQAAESILLTAIPAALSIDEEVRILLLSADNLFWTLRRPDPESVFAHATDPAHPAVQAARAAIRVMSSAFRGAPAEAISAADGLDVSILPDAAAMMASTGLVAAYGDIGRTEEIDRLAGAAHDLAARSPDAAGARLLLSAVHLDALILAGRIDDAQAVAEQVQNRTHGLPRISLAFSAAHLGQAALGAGKVDAARRWLHEAVHGNPGQSVGLKIYLIEYTVAAAIAGDYRTARAAVTELDQLPPHPAYALLDPQRMLARAWVAAAEGAITEAIDVARRATECAAARQQYAREVMCLQVATQFGDRTTSQRLGWLAARVGGPRPTIACSFATAIDGEDGDGILAASARFEAIGDLLAAADAAAHASIVFRTHGRRGSESAAAARARHLAERCGQAATPALRQATRPSPLTVREREVISLVAQGLTNRQIAERLHLSIRTVEGHLYRAAERTGVSNRNDLTDTLWRLRRLDRRDSVQTRHGTG